MVRSQQRYLALCRAELAHGPTYIMHCHLHHASPCMPAVALLILQCDLLPPLLLFSLPSRCLLTKPASPAIKCVNRIHRCAA